MAAKHIEHGLNGKTLRMAPRALCRSTTSDTFTAGEAVGPLQSPVRPDGCGVDRKKPKPEPGPS